jgi:hypothetical protein
LPFGPGRVGVLTENIRMAKVSDRALFGGMSSLSPPARTFDVIQFDLSSDTNFHAYFDGRQIQVRCTVDRNIDRSEASGGYGPFYDGVNLASYTLRPKSITLTPRPRDGRFSYTVYAFADLSESSGFVSALK